MKSSKKVSLETICEMIMEFDYSKNGIDTLADFANYVSNLIFLHGYEVKDNEKTKNA